MAIYPERWGMYRKESDCRKKLFFSRFETAKAALINHLKDLTEFGHKYNNLNFVNLMEQRDIKNVNKCLNTNIYSY